MLILNIILQNNNAAPKNIWNTAIGSNIFIVAILNEYITLSYYLPKNIVY